MYADEIYRYLLKLSSNEKIAEDLTQDIFLSAVKHCNKFVGNDDNIKAWLITIAKNHFYSSIRKKESSNISLSGVTETQSDSRDFTDRLIDKEQVKRIHIIVHSLEEPFKEIFTLRVFGELSFKDIAALFNKTESWAKVTFYRTKSKIIKTLEEEENKNEM